MSSRAHGTRAGSGRRDTRTSPPPPSPDVTRSKRRRVASKTKPEPSSVPATAPRRTWPDADPTTVPFPSCGLLSGLDEAVWSALAHVPPRDFDTDKGKQVVIRKALNLICMGWVATNTTAYRRAVGAKFDAARKVHEANGWSPPGAPLPTIRKVEIDDRVLGEDGECRLELFPGSKADGKSNEVNVKKIREVLKKHGVAVVRRAMDASAAPQKTQQKGRIKIQHTTGNGVAGTGSYYTDVTNIEGRCTDWTELQDNILRCFLSDASAVRARGKRKAILLKYGEGAENWAHRDGNSDGLFPYQAAIMLSQPDVDFTGGEFYVAKKGSDGRSIVRTRIEFKHRGDMVIFEAANDGESEHGMMAVKRGSAEICERIAVGLLQQM